jgi:succinyl-CoA synthetase beta subunit
VEEVGLSIPVVVRLEGNQAELGAKLLEESQLNVIAATSLSDAAKKMVEAVK